MYQTLSILGIVLAVLSGASLIASIAMFVGFKVPTLWKDWNGTLEQKQIEEIRQKSSAAAQQRGKVNVFEDLEKKAKVKRANTHSLNVGPTTAPKKTEDPGTSVLQQNAAAADPNFVIEKNVMFVSTNEVV